MFIFSTTYCQVKTPALSTKSKISQVVGLTDIEVEYSRPAVKSRKIFGGVVPYNKIWRTGANKNTTISAGSIFLQCQNYNGRLFQVFVFHDFLGYF